MKYLYSFIVVVLFQITFAQEQAVFYFDNNKFELNKVEAAKLQKWIADNATSKILSIADWELARRILSSVSRLRGP